MRLLIVMLFVLSFASAQTELATFFSPKQLTALEQLVTLSENVSPTVLEAQHALDVVVSTYFG